jgi:hypothetical protein
MAFLSAFQFYLGERKPMAKVKTSYGIATILCAVLLMVGCNDMNRKHFTKLELIKTENGSQYFQYRASTGTAGLACAPGSKTCKIDNSYRVPLWPLEDEEAEKIRMTWLEKSLSSEYGFRCENAEYEIVRREPIFENSMYDICYDVKVKPRLN